MENNGTPSDPMPERPKYAVGSWLVVRHAGRRVQAGRHYSKGPWRFVFWGADESQARQVFANHRMTMRQGGLRLVDPNDVVVREQWEPRLRTRW